MREDLYKVWEVKPCPCGRPGCTSAIIEPWIVKLQGATEKDIADHIVVLHNNWLRKQNKEKHD